MAGLATLLPDSIACHSSSASYAAASELLRKFMLVRCLLVMLLVCTSTLLSIFSFGELTGKTHFHMRQCTGFKTSTSKK